MLTRQQLYDLYYEGLRATIHLIENLLAHLADVERFVGHRQQMTIDGLAQKVKLLLARVERLKAELWKEQSLNGQLTRRIQQLQAELERQEAGEHNDAAARQPLRGLTRTTHTCRLAWTCQERRPSTPSDEHAACGGAVV